VTLVSDAVPCTVGRPPSPAWHGNGANKALMATRNHELIEAMRAHPAASAGALAALLGVGIGSIAGRRQRLAARGLLIKDRRGHWRVAEPARSSDSVDGADDISEFETPERQAPLLVFDRRRWVWPIDFYVDLVFNSSPFACRKYG
jgi:hypothetical protein